MALVGQSLKNAIWTYRLTPGTLFRVSRGILHSWRVFLRFANAHLGIGHVQYHMALRTDQVPENMFTEDSA